MYFCLMGNAGEMLFFDLKMYNEIKTYAVFGAFEWKMKHQSCH